MSRTRCLIIQATFLAIGIGLFVTGIAANGIDQHDLERTGKLIITVSVILVALNLRTRREDAAFRAGFEMRQKIDARQREQRRGQLRLVTDLPIESARGLAADDESAHVEVRGDRRA